MRLLLEDGGALLLEDGGSILTEDSTPPPPTNAVPFWRTEPMPAVSRTLEANAMAWIDKDPNDVADYAVDWTRWLAGDTIDTSEFSIVSGASLVVESSSHTDTIATVWLSGGAAGSRAQVLNRITTAGGRTFDKTITLDIKER